MQWKGQKEMKRNNIYLGDSYELIKNIPDKSVDLIYTDIPYLYGSGGGSGSELGKRITATKKVLDDANITDGINMDILHDFVRVMKKINIFIWCSKKQMLDILNWFDQNTETFFEVLVWAKTNPTPSTNNKWLPDLEYCLYFRESGVPLNDGYHLKSKFDVKPINKRDKDLYQHPTIKPLDMVKRHIEHTTQEGDLVADFFLGSGTTAVAAKELKRDYIGVELVEEYYEIAENRLNGIDARGQTSIFTFMEGLDIDE